MKKPMDLGVGDPDLKAPALLAKIARKSINEGRDCYASPAGQAILRKAIAAKIGADANNVVITPGSRWAINLAMKVCTRPGERIVVLGPAWHGFSQIARANRLKVRVIDCLAEKKNGHLGFMLPRKKLSMAMTKNTGMIVVNSPNNPTSTTLQKPDIEFIERLAREKGAYVLSDEAYRDLAFDGRDNKAPEGKNVIKIGTFSKTFSMTGWRIGYVVFPQGKMARQAEEQNRIFITNVPLFIQDAALAAAKMRDTVAKGRRKIFARRLRVALGILEKSQGLQLCKPDAGFYIFVRRRGLDAVKLAKKLAKKGVLISPGTMFGDYRDCFRIALIQNGKKLVAALKIIADELGQK